MNANGAAGILTVAAAGNSAADGVVKPHDGDATGVTQAVSIDLIAATVARRR